MFLPEYLSVEASNSYVEPTLRNISKLFVFPLSEEDKHDISTLEAKFDQEESIAGLAAPQIGIAKRAIVFAVPDDPNLKKFRHNLTQTMPKTIWLNPSYKPLLTQKHEDYEACFSVKDRAALVRRYKVISYVAYDKEGNLSSGIAEGFLARVIQHEIDHLNGKLFIDYVKYENLLTIEQYKTIRKERLS